jgi:hypothetical protein
MPLTSAVYKQINLPVVFKYLLLILACLFFYFNWWMNLFHIIKKVVFAFFLLVCSVWNYAKRHFLGHKIYICVVYLIQQWIIRKPRRIIRDSRFEIRDSLYEIRNSRFEIQYLKQPIKIKLLNIYLMAKEMSFSIISYRTN